MTAETEPRLTLEACICGEHFDCPDGWHDEDEMPCSCTPDCALEPEERYQPMDDPDYGRDEDRPRGVRR